MGKKLNEYREENKDKMVIGFCLELLFRQSSITHDLRDFISFIKDNSFFINSLDLSLFFQGIESFNSLFLYYTDNIYNDVDPNETHCAYYKDFY